MDEQLQVMDKQLLYLEKMGKTEEGIQSLFRVAHTLKGSSAAMGIDVVKNLTHEMEQVLDGVRSFHLAITPAMIDLLFACLDHLKTIKEDLYHGNESSVEIDMLIVQLKETADPSHEAHQPSVTIIPEETYNKYEINISIVSSCEMKLAR